jgi:hypothetical protein
MEAMLRISLYSYLYFKLAKKCYVFLTISNVFASTKLEKRAEQDLPGSEGGRERRKRIRGGGRDVPNNVYTYE